MHHDIFILLLKEKSELEKSKMLSKTDMLVSNHFLKGFSEDEICQILKISRTSMLNHKRSIINKLNLREENLIQSKTRSRMTTWMKCNFKSRGLPIKQNHLKSIELNSFKYGKGKK